MAAVFDVKEFALELLERAKESLRREKRLAPVGFVLRANGTMDLSYFEAHDNEEEGRQIESFLRAARNGDTLAVITIHDSEGQSSLPGNGGLRSGSDGKDGASPLLEARPSSRHCIIVRIDTPGKTPTVLKNPYVLNEAAEFTFEPLAETSGDLEAPTSPPVRPGELSKD